MDGEDWKYKGGDAPLTQADAVRYRQQGTRLLWVNPQIMMRPVEGRVLEVSSNRSYVLMQVGGVTRSCSFFRSLSENSTVWMAIEDVQVLSLLEPDELIDARKKGFEKPKPITLPAHEEPLDLDKFFGKGGITPLDNDEDDN